MAQELPTDLGRPGFDPILVEVYRGDIVESRHLVDAAVVDTDGKIVEAWGDVARPVYPRSACKPLQAIPLVESGAAEAFELGDKEIALACASHNGEPVHVETVLTWLDRLGLGDDDLECGGHLARNPTVLSAFVQSGAPLRQANSNCSGKHSGMLSHAVHLGEATGGYIEPAHPVQCRVKAALAAMYGLDLDRAPIATDGCGIPTLAVPTTAMAQAMARFANPDGLESERAAACRRIARAMLAEPYMVAGMERFCTELMRAARGRVLAKTGAEGVYMAGLPETGMGIALKTHDGTGRGAEMVLAALLRRHKVLDEAAQVALSDRLDPILHNVRGREIGRLRAAHWSIAAPF